MRHVFKLWRKSKWWLTQKDGCGQISTVLFMFTFSSWVVWPSVIYFNVTFYILNIFCILTIIFCAWCTLYKALENERISFHRMSLNTAFQSWHFQCSLYGAKTSLFLIIYYMWTLVITKRFPCSFVNIQHAQHKNPGWLCC